MISEARPGAARWIVKRVEGWHPNTGPLLDEHGEVVGYATLPLGASTPRDDRIAVDIGAFNHLMQKAEFVFNPAPILTRECHNPSTFSFDIEEFDRDGGKYEVELALLPPNTKIEQVRHVVAAKRGPQMYSVTFVPVPESNSPPPASLPFVISVTRNGELVGQNRGVFRFQSEHAPADPVTQMAAAADTLSVPAKVPEAVQLGGKITDVVLGGSGRFLILHVPSLRHLAVFDVSEAKVTGFVPLPSDHVLSAASAEKLVVVLPDEGIIQRWSLLPLKKDFTRPVPPGGRIDTALIGYASEGPLMLMRRSGPSFVDLNSLREFDVPIPANSLWFPGQEYPLSVAVSADGREFSGWQPRLSPPGARTLRISGNVAIVSFANIDAGYVLPNFDGSMLYSAAGLYRAEPVEGIDPTTFRKMKCIPTASAEYFIVARFSDFGGQLIEPATTFAVYTCADRRLLFQVPVIDELSRIPWRPRGLLSPTYVTPLPIEQRIYYVPAANLLVTIPDSGDQLILRRMNVVEEMNKQGIDYFFIASRPPVAVFKNEDYDYQLIVKSKQGGVNYRLEAAPPGMKISPTGRIEWSVPLDFSDAKVPVVVTLEDKSGQSIDHRFNINIMDR